MMRITAALLILLFPLQVLAAETFNMPDRPQCPSLLGGQPGTAFTNEAAARLRSQATIELPGALKTNEVLKNEIDALTKSLLSKKDEVEWLNKSLTYRKQENEDLRKTLSNQSPSNKALWTFLGLALGVVATVAVVYALRPANPGAATTSSSLAVRSAPRMGLGFRF